MMHLNVKSTACQQGAATLIVVLVLALIMAVISLTTAYTGVMEQKLIGNDLRAREAQEAAEAGLEYGAAWAAQNNVPWPIGGNTLTCPLANGCPQLPNLMGFSTGETYSISSLVYSRLNLATDFIRVTATAVASTDNSITYTARSYVKPESVLTSNGKLPPPLVLDQCMTATTGSPTIFPNWHDLDGDDTKDPNEWQDDNGNGTVDAGEWIDSNGNGNIDNEMGRAIITSKNEFVNGNFCLDYCGPGAGACNPTTPGTGRSHLSLNNGVLQNNVAYPNNSIWDYYFNISQAKFQALAAETLDTSGGLYWITGSGNWAGGTYGTAANPVIIVFANGCPKPTGNTIVFGILFFLELNGCINSPMNGWGNVTVYGSIGINGGVDKMNANMAIHGVGDDNDVTQLINFSPFGASRLPGTWKDF